MSKKPKPVITYKAALKLKDTSAVKTHYQENGREHRDTFFLVRQDYFGEFEKQPDGSYKHKPSGKLVTHTWHQYLQRCASAWTSYDGYAVNTRTRETMWMFCGVFTYVFENSDYKEALQAVIQDELNRMFNGGDSSSMWETKDGITIADTYGAYNGQGDKIMLRVLNDDGTLHPMALWWEETFAQEKERGTLPPPFNERLENIQTNLEADHEFGSFVEYHIDSDWKMWMDEVDDEARLNRYQTALMLLQQHSWEDYVSSEQFVRIGFPRSYTQNDQDFVMGLALGFAGCFSEELDQEIAGQAEALDNGEEGYSEWYVRFLYLCAHIRRDRPGVYGQIERNGHRMHHAAQKYIPTRIGAELKKVWDSMEQMTATHYAALIALGQEAGHDGHDPDQDMTITPNTKRGHTALMKKLAALLPSKRAKLIEIFYERVGKRKIVEISGPGQEFMKLFDALMKQWDTATEIFGRWNRPVSDRLAQMEDIQRDITKGEVTRAWKMDQPKWAALHEDCVYQAYCQFLLDTHKFYEGGIFGDDVRLDFCTPANA